MDDSMEDLASKRSAEVRHVTWVGLCVNICLAALKFAAGIIGHSQAVIADAVHSLSDMTTDIAILLGVRYWNRPADEAHPHGHRRIEVIVTMLIGVVLALVATGLLWNAIITLRQQHDRPPEWIALAAAILSMCTKEILYRWTVTRGQRVKSMTLVANAWHHRSDALGSVPAALAVAGAMAGPAWSFLDHVGAAAVSLFIYQAAFRIIHPTINKLMDQGAPKEDLERIRALAINTPGVSQVHRIRTRYVGCSALAVDLHVIVDHRMTVREGHDISEAVKETLMAEGPEVMDVVVHLEPDEEE